MYIAAYHIDAEGKPGYQDLIEQLYQAYGGKRSNDLNSLRFESGPFSVYLKALSERGYRIFLVAAGSTDLKREDLDSMPSYEKLNGIIQSLKTNLPEKADSDYTLSLAYVSDVEEAGSLVRRHAKNTSRQLISAGLVRGCMLATLGMSGSSAVVSSSELVVLPCGLSSEDAAEAAWRICFEVSSLATYTGEMNRLYSERELMLNQIDASENSTQLRINEILSQMRKPLDEIQPADLENILKEITIQFSRLSTLTSSMRRDNVKAKSILRGARYILKGWSEKSFDESTMNSTLQMDYLENLMAPFGDFIERTEALTGQLNTVLDSVRTYLGIQQQKVSIEEQTSSKEQLVRLVNLQEILHKLEILIVAFYLTEMAKIVFDSLMQESASILTVAFIPVALLISVMLSRLLHRKG